MKLIQEKVVLFYKAIYGFILTVFLDNFDKPDYYEANVLTLTNRDELAKEISKLFKHYYPSRSGEILDIAAGSGIISRELFKSGYKVTACDLNEFALAFLKRKTPKIETIVADMNNILPFDSDRFDGVTSVWANRYIRDVEKFLNEVHRVLKPRGVFIWPVFKIDIGLWKIHAGLNTPSAFESLEANLRKTGFSRVHFIQPGDNIKYSIKTIFIRPYYFVCYK